MPAMTRLRSLLLAVGWTAAALLLALGAAGIVTGVGGPPGTSARAELTWAGDEAIRPGLAAALDDLEALTDLVGDYSTSARGALVALVATDRDLLERSVAEGDGQAQAVASAAEALRAEILALPGVAPDPTVPFAADAELRLGADERAMVVELLAALELTRDLGTGWARFSAGSVAADALTTLLIDHDASTAAAASAGSAGRYEEALAALDASDRILADARRLRDRLANTTDVTTLDQWLDRNAIYDAALRALYSALGATGGRVDATVREAFAAEQAAREQLPPDTRGLTIILAEVARGGLNDVAIGIEEVRGRLEAATEELRVVELAPTADPPGS
jgi:hypothetical protein